MFFKQKEFLLIFIMIWLTFPSFSWADNKRPDFNQSRYKEDYRFLKNLEKDESKNKITNICNL